MVGVGVCSNGGGGFRAGGVGRVRVAVQDPAPRVDGGGCSRLRAAVIAVKTGVLQQEAEQLNAGFLLRVTQQYMNVLRTGENLTSALAEERALSRQLDQSNERYKVGLVPITDVNEAQAAYDLSRVGLIVAQSDFGVARDQLEALTGKRWESLDGLQAELPMAGPEPADPDTWVVQAQANNPQVQIARRNAESAKAVSRQGLGAQMPSVNLIGQYQHQHLLGLDTSAPASTAFSWVTKIRITACR